MSDILDAALEQSAINSAFNASQAEINRDWQEFMSSTSHQREVNDLIAAGLNPVLSANNGSTWAGVANGTADPSGAQALANVATTMLNNQASIEMSKIAAQAQVAAASSAASIAAAATRDAARTAADAQIQIGEMNTATKLMTDTYSFGAMLIDSATGGDAGRQWQDFYNKYVHG